MFCNVRVCYRLVVEVVKAMHTAYMLNILLESLLNDVSNVLVNERYRMMDTQAIDVVTFDFKGTRVL